LPTTTASSASPASSPRPTPVAGRTIHFEVYPDLDSATSSDSKLATSQLALPEDICRTVCGAADCPQSLSNLQQTPLNRDMVFVDGVDQQMAAVTGDVNAGYKASLVVGL
jgi:hypothetical protein